MFIALNLSKGEALNTSRLFTSLAVITLITQPLSQLLQHIPGMLSAVECFARIQKYLTSTENPWKSLGETGVEPQDFTSIQENPYDIQLQEISASPSKSGSSKQLFDISDASLGWSSTDPAVLKAVNLSFREAQFYMIVGPVASGKSTLLKSLLQETTVTNGTVSSTIAEVAFCDQSPWLSDTTIMRNITDGSIFSPEWYNAVIKACALDVDMLQMPRRDQTKVGSKGTALSGGQKQRIVRFDASAYTWQTNADMYTGTGQGCLLKKGLRVTRRHVRKPRRKNNSAYC